MKKNKPILKLLIFTFVLVSPVLFFKAYVYFCYENEMHNIKNELNIIPETEVINIWGHQDITLEEISARILIKEKGELVLSNLSKDVFEYPSHVYISEIGGFSFLKLTKTGYDYNLDIGSESPFGKRLCLQFRKPSDVVVKYDKILSLIKTLKTYPDSNHFKNNGKEFFLTVIKKIRKDEDPIYTLLDSEKIIEYSKELPWEKPNQITPSNTEIKKPNQKKEKTTILIVPISNSYGYEKDFNPIIEKELKKNPDFEIIRFPYKKFNGSGFQGVNDKKYAKEILDKVKADIYVMSWFAIPAQEIPSGEKFNWGYHIKVLNTKTMKQKVSIGKEHLENYNAIEESISKNAGELIKDILALYY